MDFVAHRNWKSYRLDQLGFVGRGRSRNRPRNDPALYGGPYPLFETGDIKSATLYLSNYKKTYNEKGLSQSKLWNPGTLCITIAANIAETAILKIKACFPDSVVGFVANPEKTDIRYIKYHIDFIKLRMQNVSHGTTQDNLSLGKLLTFDFLMPPLKIQRRIADILSAYDDLIEINRQRIALLERAGREIYREWFVRLRFPGYERTKIVDGVPEGWEQIKVGNLLGRIRSKKRIKKTDYLDSGLFPCVDQSREFIGGYTDDLDAIHETPLPVIVFGDHTRIVKFIDFPFARGADGTQLLIPNRNDMSVVQFYFALEAIDLSNYFYARHFKFLKHQVMLVPTKSLGDKFTAIAGEIMEQIKGLREQNRKLSKARDLLLPRLMTGQLAF